MAATLKTVRVETLRVFPKAINKTEATRILKKELGKGSAQLRWRKRRVLCIISSDGAHGCVVRPICKDNLGRDKKFIIETRRPKRGEKRRRWVFIQYEKVEINRGRLSGDDRPSLRQPCESMVVTTRKFLMALAIKMGISVSPSWDRQQ